MSLPGLYLELTASVAHFQRDMNEAAEIAEKTAGRIQRAFDELKEVMLGVSEALVFEKIIDEAGEAEQAFAQLEAGVKSTGEAAGYTADQLQEMAEALKKNASYSGEAIEKAESLLLTFTKIGHEAFPQAVQATLDLAARFGTDLPSAAIRLGKALQDPVKGVTALSKAGVSFSESQKAAMKTMIDAGNIAGAQSMIFKELSVEVGGSAKAMHDTLKGAADAVKISFNDLLKNIGLSQSDGLRGVLNSLSGAMDMAAEHAKLVSNGIMGIAAAAAILTAAQLPETLAKIGALLGTAFGGEAGAVIGLAVLTAGIIAFKDEQIKAGDETVSISAVMRATWQDTADVFKEAWDTATSLVGSQWTELQAMFNNAWITLRKDMENFSSAFQAIWTMVASELRSVFGSVFDQFVSLIAHAGKAISDFSQSVAKAFSIPGADVGVEKFFWQDEQWKRGASQIMGDAGSLFQQDQAKKKAEEEVGPKPDDDGPGSSKLEQQFQKWYEQQKTKLAAIKEEIAGHKELAQAIRDKGEVEQKFGKLSSADQKQALDILKQIRQATHDDDFQKYLTQQKAKIAGLQEELTHGKEAADFARERATLEERIGKLTDAQAKALQDVVNKQRELTALKELQAKSDELRAQRGDIADAMSGDTHHGTVNRVRQDLQKKGLLIGQNSDSVNSAVHDVLDQAQGLDIDKQHLATFNSGKKIDDDIQKKTDILNLGQKQAEIEEKIRQFKRDDSTLTNDELDKLRQKLDYDQQINELTVGKDVIKQLQEQTKEQENQLEQRKLLLDRLGLEATTQKEIFDWEQKTGLQIDENSKALIKEEVQRQGLIADANRALDIIEKQKQKQIDYNDAMSNLNRLLKENLLTQQEYNKAVLANSDGYQKVKDAAKSVGDTLAKAFEDATIGGKKFGDVLSGLAKQIEAIVVKKAVVQPLGNAISKGITNAASGFFLGKAGAVGTGGGAAGKIPKGIQDLLAGLGFGVPNNLKKNPNGPGGGAGSGLAGGGSGNGSGPGLVDGLTGNPAVQSPMGQVWSGMAEDLSAIRGLIAQSVNGGGSPFKGGSGGGGLPYPPGPSNFPGFALGGRPFSGMPSIVGESGPELFVPDSSGTVFPNSLFQGMQDDDWDLMMMQMQQKPQGIGMGSKPGVMSGGSIAANGGPMTAAQVNQLWGAYYANRVTGDMQIGAYQQANADITASQQFLNNFGTPNFDHGAGSWSAPVLNPKLPPGYGGGSSGGSGGGGGGGGSGGGGGHGGSFGESSRGALVDWNPIPTGSMFGQHPEGWMPGFDPHMNNATKYNGGISMGPQTASPAPFADTNSRTFNELAGEIPNGLGAGATSGDAGIFSGRSNPYSVYAPSAYGGLDAANTILGSGLANGIVGAPNIDPNFYMGNRNGIFDQRGNSSMPELPMQDPPNPAVEPKAPQLPSPQAIANINAYQSWAQANPDDQLAQIQAQQQLASQARQLSGALQSGGADAAWDTVGSWGNDISGFADGGDPPLGAASLVGERGPELFVPKTAGTIIPNDKLGGGGDTNVHVHNYTPHQVDVQHGPDGKDISVTIGKMISQQIKNGQIGKVLEDRYNLKPKGTRR